MADDAWLAERFEEHRGHLRAVAYRMLGSLAEADDAVQDAWLRLSRSASDEIDNLGGWLTTVVARICLNMLRSRKTRREDPLDVHLPDPIVSTDVQVDPEHQAVLADSVGLALLVVLDTLSPAERLAFVLHDMFDLPFDEIASLLGGTPAAARQLASRARRRVRGVEPAAGEADLARQREVVDAFFAAAREGDFDSLVAVLHPDVVLRIDGGAAYAATTMQLRGVQAVVGQVRRGLRSLLAQPILEVHPAVVNGSAGVVVRMDGQPMTIMGFTVVEGRIIEIDSLADPDRVGAIVGSSPS